MKDVILKGTKNMFPLLVKNLAITLPTFRILINTVLSFHRQLIWITVSNLPSEDN